MTRIREEEVQGVD